MNETSVSGFSFFSSFFLRGSRKRLTMTSFACGFGTSAGQPLIETEETGFRTTYIVSVFLSNSTSQCAALRSRTSHVFVPSYEDVRNRPIEHVVFRNRGDGVDRLTEVGEVSWCTIVQFVRTTVGCFVAANPSRSQYEHSNCTLYYFDIRLVNRT